MKSSMQLKANVRNVSKEMGISAEIVLRYFMHERFLERMALSKYKENFILKGGLLVAAMVGKQARSTMDMDITIKGRVLNELDLVTMIENIVHVPIDDGVNFRIQKIEPIRDASDYPGYRIRLDSLFDGICQSIQIDISTGDFVTPNAIEFHFPMMFEQRAICIMSYNVESVLAEKVESIITRGVLNTRMRDFYDVYILTTTRAFSPIVFKQALMATTKNRQTVVQISNAEAVLQSILTNTAMISQWKRYQLNNPYAEGIPWESAIHAISQLFSYTVSKK